MIGRPSRLHSSKDKKYHLEYAKACLEDGYSSNHIAFQYKCEINKLFYKGEQWVFGEDLDPFFMDDSGESRNRIKFVQNIIRPYVEYYRGSIIKMDMAGQAVSTTGHAIDRREAKLEEVMLKSYIVENAPKELRGILAKNAGVEETQEETLRMFQNLYKDEFLEDVNAIISTIASENEVELMKLKMCEDIAMTGMAAVMEQEVFGRQVWTNLDPTGVILDRSAKRADFKDSEYIGCVRLASVADIAEEYPTISPAKLRSLEERSRESYSREGALNIFNISGGTFGRIPLVKMFWRDIERDLWVPVYDENENPVLKRYDILVEELGSERLADAAIIKVKDLKDYEKENDWITKIFRKGKTLKNKAYVYTDVVRYCYFTTFDHQGRTCTEDDIIDFGILPYQTLYSYKSRHVDFPIKVSTWSYIDGDILSPIDTLISPQRFINRMLSMGESRINNSRGSGVFYDKDMIPSGSSEEEIQRDMNLGKPIAVEAGGLLNNSVVSYGNDLGSGTLQLFNVVSTIKTMAESVIGGGESLTGQGGSYRASAKVAQQNLDQGTTMQEPVFFAVSNLIMSMYTSMANKGRRILAMNRELLESRAGSDTFRIIQLSKHLSLEEYRAEIVRTGTPEKEKEAANEILIMLYSQQLLSPELLAEAYGKTTINQIGAVLRKHSNIQIETARQQQKIAEQQQQMAMQQQKSVAEAQAAEEDLNFAIQQQQMAQQAAQSAQPAQEAKDMSYGEATLMESILDNKNNL